MQIDEDILSRAPYITPTEPVELRVYVEPRLNLLEDLANYLEANAEALMEADNFRMAAWLQNVGKPDAPSRATPPSACGFAGCAVGHALVNLPSWQAAGLHFSDSQGDGKLGILERGNLLFVSAGTAKQKKANDKLDKPYHAVALVLGLPIEDVNRLFRATAYTERSNPRMVARRLRAYIAWRNDSAWIWVE